MKRGFKFGVIVTFALFVILSAYFVSAVGLVLTTPSPLNFSQNDAANYDNDGTIFLNWTGTAAENKTYRIFISLGSALPFKVAVNDSALGYTFTNTTEGNYTFIVEAINSTATSPINSTANVTWMVIDSTVPVIAYNLNTDTASSGADRDWIFVNVTATETNVVSSMITFSIYNSTGVWNKTNFSYVSGTPQTINWSGLVNAAYTFNVTANDSATNENSTSSRTFDLDGTNPGATAACSPSTIYENDAFPCTCSGTDALSTVTKSASSTSGSTTDTSVIGLYTYTCTATDAIGNSASDTEIYTVLKIGGGGTTTPGPPKKTTSWTKITPGAAAIMKDFNAEIGVKQIQIEVNNEAQNVKITVTKYDEKPAEVSVTKSGKVYQYLQIDAQNLGNNMNKATVQFKVEKSWVSGNSLDKDELSVYKFDSTAGKWNELATTYASEDNQYYYYDAELNSFSYFVISEKSLASGEGTTATGETPTAEGRSSAWLWILIALVIVFVVWWFMSKKTSVKKTK